VNAEITLEIAPGVEVVSASARSTRAVASRIYPD